MSRRTHILTIVVEDYFHVAAMRGAVARKHWERLEPRLAQNLADTLTLLDRHDVRATFFVLGSIAEQQPELVQRIVDRGHEIASRGFWPRAMRGLSPAELLDDLRRSRQALEAAGANRILGYRAPTWLREEELWMLDLLVDEGYRYDSSLNPILRRFAGQPQRLHLHRHGDAQRGLWEFPVATTSLLGLRVAISGGNYLRQLPHSLLKRVVARQSAASDEPLVFYFMPWELDKRQPHIQGLSTVQRVRHYRNLEKTRWVLEDYFRHYRFVGIADYLGLPLERPAPTPRRARPEVATAVGGAPVSLVIPLFNEQQNIDYLQRTLLDFRRRLAGTYRFHLILVDDGSTDDTWTLLEQRFAAVPDCELVRLPENRGVAAAILTGIRRAPTEIVCSIDCDCSYDPADLAQMIPLLQAPGGADLVTASPYHPDGQVLHVPRWRLFLSKTLSRLYSVVLSQRLHTFTSCCRVYRKSALQDLEVRSGGFLGVAELLIALQLAGGRVVEYPATLERRLLGESKMKVARTIYSHLGLLRRLVWRRLRGGRRAAPPTRPTP